VADGLTATNVQGATAKAANVFWDWGVPLAALGIGYTMGDFLNIGDMISNLTKGKVPAIGTVNTTGLLTAGLFAAIAIALWRALTGMPGKVIGFFFIGVALAVLREALAV
jgi:hypothetical protein